MKKIMISICAVMCAVGAFAQSYCVQPCQPPCGQRVLFPNLFVEAGVGASVFMGGQRQASVMKQVSAAFDLGVGTWITPAIGVRVQFNYNPAMKEYALNHTSPFSTGKAGEQKFNFWNLHGDLMINLMKTFGSRNPKVYSLIPYVGAGVAQVRHKDASSRSSEFVLNGGLINKFQISKVVDLNLELRGVLSSGRLDLSTINNRFDIPLIATVGATFRLF